MKEYSVRIVIPIAVRVDSIMANSQIEAIKIAEEFIDPQSYNQVFSHDPITGQDRPIIRFTEYAEGELPPCALVDEAGDTEYGNSTWYLPTDFGEWKEDKYEKEAL